MPMPAAISFALGAVLYEMVTGKRAFEGKTAASTIAAVLAADPPPISTVQPLSPSALEATVRSCLAKDPDERVQTAHDVKLQLQVDAGEHASSSASAAAAPAARKPLDHCGLACRRIAAALAGWCLRVVAAQPRDPRGDVLQQFRAFSRAVCCAVPRRADAGFRRLFRIRPTRT